MSDSHTSPGSSFNGCLEEMRSALFAQMVLQQSSMAMMLLGKTVHPQTGEVVRDLDAARLFIDQLEMLEHKTKGNLTSTEESTLRNVLYELRMAYLEVTNLLANPPKDGVPKEN